MIAIIDYGAGNLRSVANAVAKVGYVPNVTSDPGNVLAAHAVILPGVGAAGDAMRNLRRTSLDGALRRLTVEDRPLFAVSLGMQVLLSSSEERAGQACLGIIPGVVRRLPAGLKVPHMGWNQVKQAVAHPIFDGIPDEANFHFVHSYYAQPADISLVAGTTDYGASMSSVLIKGNLVATQFHPEKSGEVGLRMYANFLKMAIQRRG